LVTFAIVAGLAAAGFAGYSRYVDSTDYLAHAITDSELPGDRIAAIDRLSGRDEPAVVPALVRALEDRDVDVRVKALERLEVRRPAAIVPALVRIATDGEFPHDRVWAVRQLADRNDPSILPALVRASDDRHPTVKVAALERRVARRDPAVVAALVAALVPTPDDRAVPRAAAKLLGQLPAGQAFNPIMEALPAQHDPDVIDELVAALGRFGDTRAAPAMLAAVNQLDNPSLLRERIIKAIATLPPSASAALVGALGSFEPATRNNAALAAAAFVASHPETAGAFVAPVLRTIEDPSRMVQDAAWEALYAVIRALGKAGGPAALPALQAILAANPSGGTVTKSLWTSPGPEIFGAALADVGADAFPFVLKLGREWLSIEVVALSEFARRQPALRAKAVDALVALAMRGSPAQHDALLALFEFSDRAVAAAVAPLLYEKDGELISIAAQLIFTASEDSRATVLDALRRNVNPRRIGRALATVAVERKPGWEAAAAALDAALKDNNLAVGSGAYSYFIAEQRVDAVAYLKSILSAQGDDVMAEALMNSGNDDLSANAEAWARAHGFQVISLPVSGASARRSWGGR
jgi:HEAT repeat protein